MSEIDELMQRGADAYAAGDFAVAQEAWQAAADAGHDGAYDALRLLAHGDTRRQVLWGKLAERDNAIVQRDNALRANRELQTQVRILTAERDEARA